MARLRYLQNARTGTAGTISKSTYPLQFYDDDMYIYASADGVLEIVSDTTLTLTAPTINVTSSTVTAYTYPISITYACTATNVSCLTITSSSSSTSGSVVIKPLYVDATMSATGGLGRAIEGKLLVSGKLGDYGNAIKGYTDLTGGTGCAGLVSAICAEMRMPKTTALGTHTVLEIELVTQEGSIFQQGTGTNCTSLIRARVSGNGTAVTSFNDYGYFLDLQGLTTGSTDLFDTCTLKCAIGSTKYYLPLSLTTGCFNLADDIQIKLGTTLTTAATRITMEFDETTTGIGMLAFGTSSAPMVYNTNPGAGGVAVIDIHTTHSAGAGDAVWLYGVSSHMIISGDGDSGTKLAPIYASILLDEAAVSSAYTIRASLTHDGTDSITGAAAVVNADLYIESGNFEAEQTLQTAIFTLRSEGATTVTCTSENFNVVLIKNLSTLAGINSMIKIASVGADNPTSMINFEGTADEGVFYFDADSDCVADTGDPGAAGTSGTCAASHKIKCNYNGTTFYLAGFADF